METHSSKTENTLRIPGVNLKHVSILAGIVFLLLSGNMLATSKIDTIYIQNGDRITGEVKSLYNNQLRLSTDDAGTIRLEWEKVDSVHILNFMRIVLKDGKIFYGKILPSGEAKSCYIWSTEGDLRQVRIVQIVELSPVQSSFFSRLDGSVGSGFSYTKASKVLQANLNTTLDYLAEKNQFEISYGGIFTRQSDTASTQWQNGGITFRRIMPKNWFLLAQLLAESNSEQKLDLRTTAGFGAGHSIIRSNSSHFFAAGGFQANRELAEDVDQYNVEGIIQVDYSIFIYDSPEVSFNTTGKIIPSLNDLGRIRSELDTNLKWEILSDFFLKWTFYHRFDSRPLAGGEKGDWAVILLGVEYEL
jgi:hypothetical protein